MSAALAMLDRGRIEDARRATDALLSGPAPDPRALCLAGDLAIRLGDQRRALDLLTRCVALDGDIPRAHHLLGNVHHDRGKSERAIACFRKALRLNPYFAEAQNDLGHAYYLTNRLDDAVACFEQAIQAAPDHEIAYENLGQVLRRQQKPTEARRRLQQALRLKLVNSIRSLFGMRPPVRSPGAYLSGSPSPDTERRLDLLRRARLAFAQQDFVAADAACRDALAHDPRNVDALHIHGVVLDRLGRPDEAIGALRGALDLGAKVPEIRLALGKMLHARGQPATAAEHLLAATRLNPGLAEPHSDLSAAYFDLGRLQQAAASARTAIRLDPTVAEAHVNLAAALWSEGSSTEAERHCREAIRLKPGLANGYANLGLALKEQGRIADALSAYDEGLRRAPNDPSLHCDRGALLQEGYARYDEALASFRKAALLAPERALPRILESVLLLLRGDFQEGWHRYEWRKRDPLQAAHYRRIALPDWDGASMIAGRTLVVQGEQGLGDEVMFASCLEQASASAARTLLLCAPRLARLFERSFPAVKILAAGTPEQVDAAVAAERPDVKIAAGSLPALFRPDAASFPTHDGYLRADPARVAHWRTRLDALGPGPKIGLSWRGGLAVSGRWRRSIELHRLAPLLRHQDCNWINLQYDDCGAEIERARGEPGVSIAHWQDAIDDLDEMAALVSALDLTLSVCNTTVHLGGALGRPVWVMAPFVPDWRYGVDGERMAWYPSVRMFRQRGYGDWTSVIDEVGAALGRLPGPGR